MISAIAVPSFMTVSPPVAGRLVRPICDSWNRVLRFGKAAGAVAAGSAVMHSPLDKRGEKSTAAGQVWRVHGLAIVEGSFRISNALAGDSGTGGAYDVGTNPHSRLGGGPGRPER